MGPTLPTNIVSIRQYKTRQQSQTANYDVLMANVEASERIRNAYGSFWKKPAPGKARIPIPPILSNVSIAISHTFATRIRVKLMKEMAKHHQAANPEIGVFVTNFLPRPAFKIRHPGGRIDSYSFVDAIKRFGHHLSRDFLVAETAYAKTNIQLDHLIPYFLVLSPDLVLPSQPPTPLTTVTRSQAAKRTAESTVTPQSKKPKGGRGKSRNKGKGKATPAPGPSTNQFAPLASPEAEATDRSFVSQTDNDANVSNNSTAE